MLPSKDEPELCSLLIEGLPCASSSSSSHRSSSLCLQLPRAQLQLSSIKAAISHSTRLHADLFHLTLDGRIMHEHAKEAQKGDADASDDDDGSRCSSSLVDPSSSLLVLRVLFRSGLLGGKGGFGSLLRTATTKVGAKKTSNFSASRDLSGRRMRHVEAEAQIAEWNAQHHEPVNQQGERRETSE